MGSDGFESKRLFRPELNSMEGRRSPADLAGPVDRSVVDPFAGAPEGAAATLVELRGVIKWFDASKGYGFIVPDNGGADILLHVTVLRRDGYQTAYEGARVIVEALNRPGGLQAFRILSMDESTARHPAQLPAARTHVTVEPTSKLERLEVKWFNRIRGFGFLSAGEGAPSAAGRSVSAAAAASTNGPTEVRRRATT